MLCDFIPLNLLRLVLWPRICLVSVNVQCAPEKKVYSEVGMDGVSFIVLLKSAKFLLIFCLLNFMKLDSSKLPWWLRW